MSHSYLCSKSKTIMKKSHFVYFKADYFPTLNKKDPVVAGMLKNLAAHHYALSHCALW